MSRLFPEKKANDPCAGFRSVYQEGLVRDDNMGDDLICSICKEIFREPVQLPCRHKYCRECVELYCARSDENNVGEASSELSSASEEKMLQLEEETKTQKKLIQKLNDYVEKMVTFKAYVKAKMDLHSAEVEKAYKKINEELRAWRQEQLDCIKERHEKWIKGCDESVAHINLKSEQIKAMFKSSSASLSSLDVNFLKDSGRPALSLQRATESVEQELSQNSEKASDWKTAMDNYIVYPKRLHLTEEIISKPQMKFISPPTCCFDISESGSLISHESGSKSSVILTDVTMQTGKHYWELELKLKSYASNHPEEHRFPAPVYPFFSAGVHNQTYQTGSQKLGRIPYRVTASCSLHDTQVKLSKDESPPKSVIIDWPLVLGFYLDCEADTLTVLNCTDQSVIHTISVNLTTPVKPAVAIGGSIANFTVRLIRDELYAVPKSLTDKINQHKLK